MIDYKEDPITGSILSAAIEVHRTLGRGLSADLYKIALCSELLTLGQSCSLNPAIPIVYKGQFVGEHPIDIIVDEHYVVMIHSDEVPPEDYQTEMRTALRATRHDIGLILNFGHKRMLDGVKRVYYPLNKRG